MEEAHLNDRVNFEKSIQRSIGTISSSANQPVYQYRQTNGLGGAWMNVLIDWLID